MHYAYPTFHRAVEAALERLACTVPGRRTQIQSGLALGTALMLGSRDGSGRARPGGHEEGRCRSTRPPARDTSDRLNARRAREATPPEGTRDEPRRPPPLRRTRAAGRTRRRSGRRTSERPADRPDAAGVGGRPRPPTPRRQPLRPRPPPADRPGPAARRTATPPAGPPPGSRCRPQPAGRAAPARRAAQPARRNPTVSRVQRFMTATDFLERRAEQVELGPATWGWRGRLRRWSGGTDHARRWARPRSATSTTARAIQRDFDGPAHDRLPQPEGRCRQDDRRAGRRLHVRHRPWRRRGRLGQQRDPRHPRHPRAREPATATRP